MLLNALFFNISWFGLIVAGNIFIPVTLLWLFWHFLTCENRKDELVIVAQISAIGICIDSFLTYIGLFVFENTTLIIPVWLIMLWVSFGATIRHSLCFLNKWQYAPTIVGAGVVPFSYLAGNKLGAIDFAFSIGPTLLILAIIWLFLLNLFISLSFKEKQGYA